MRELLPPWQLRQRLRRVAPGGAKHGRLPRPAVVVALDEVEAEGAQALAVSGLRERECLEHVAFVDAPVKKN